MILLPSAIFLAHTASAGEFDNLFWSVQIIEISVGAINIILLALNARDGIILSRGRRRADNN